MMFDVPFDEVGRMWFDHRRGQVARQPRSSSHAQRGRRAGPT
jgi:hypothetical protein